MSRSSSSLSFFLTSVGIGAGLMYFYDPQNGRRRRALVRDRYQHALRAIDEGRHVVMRDFNNRATGLRAEARRLVRRDPARGDDIVLIERVRAALGRQVSHPHAIEVHSQDGIVRLEGAVLADEIDGLLPCVAAVRGVRGVENRLQVFEEAGNFPRLQGAVMRTGHRAEFLQQSWSPAARSVAGGFGLLLALAGMLRGGVRGIVMTTVGGSLLARAGLNRDLGSLARMPAGPARR